VWLTLIVQPQGTGSFPTLIQVHGCAWFSGDRMSNQSMNEALAAPGVLVASIDFRTPPEHPYPASLVDVNYATRWLKAHASDFNASPNQVGGMGSSSGGHIVMLSAMRPRDPRYAAVPLPEAPSVDASLAYLTLVWPILDPYG